MLGMALPAVVAAQEGAGAGSARIECAAADGASARACAVDTATYVGWRVYHAQCAACHGADALGSSFAPDLTRRMQGMTSREFFAALDQGYMGPNDPAPPRGRNPDVARYYNELWVYLAARVRGDLPVATLDRLSGGEDRAPD
jgi:hypothetical protein